MRNLLLYTIIPGAMTLLPKPMDTPQARAMLIAIALQESKMTYRRQLNGPAKGLWEFEIAGVNGVKNHSSTRKYANRVLESLIYPLAITAPEIHVALEHNDILACCFARLLLYTLPMPLPNEDQIDYAWEQYLSAWRPGRPHKYTWTSNFEQSWKLVSEIRNA
jgi:hypothetical protein